MSISQPYGLAMVEFHHTARTTNGAERHLHANDAACYAVNNLLEQTSADVDQHRP